MDPLILFLQELMRNAPQANGELPPEFAQLIAEVAVRRGEADRSMEAVRGSSFEGMRQDARGREGFPSRRLTAEEFDLLQQLVPGGGASFEGLLMANRLAHRNDRMSRGSRQP